MCNVCDAASYMGPVPLLVRISACECSAMKGHASVGAQDISHQEPLLIHDLLRLHVENHPWKLDDFLLPFLVALSSRCDLEKGRPKGTHNIRQKQIQVSTPEDTACMYHMCVCKAGWRCASSLRLVVRLGGCCRCNARAH